MSHKKEANKELGKVLLDAFKYFITIGIAGQIVSSCGKEINITLIWWTVAAGLSFGMAGYLLIIQSGVDNK